MIKKKMICAGAIILAASVIPACGIDSGKSPEQGTSSEISDTNKNDTTAEGTDKDKTGTAAEGADKDKTGTAAEGADNTGKTNSGTGADGQKNGETGDDAITVTDEPYGGDETDIDYDPDIDNDAVNLRQFCNDPVLDDWFNNLEKNTPVKLSYWVYGEAPIGMDFTDEELILSTAEALQTVRIGGESEENPDWVADAGGTGYYFEMEDGTKMGFSFMMGTFKWNGDTYHDVVSFGDLSEVSEKLYEIGNPQYEYIYSDDGGFYTEYLETYHTKWEKEGDFSGGLYVYLGENDDVPYFEISRCADETLDPETYITDYLEGYMKEKFKAEGAKVEPKDDIQTNTVSDKECASRHYTVTKKDGSKYTLFVLILNDEDTLLRDEHLIRFYATYDESVEGQEDLVMEEMNHAIDKFSLKHMWYDEKGVQEGQYLLDFCNDDKLRAWFEMAEKKVPDQLICNQETWEISEDPEVIKQFLEALKTVKIGGISKKTVGGAQRRIYDFMYEDTGDYMGFDFFADTFSWDMENYEVLDWGDLLDLTGKVFGNDW
jgi:hypothetical protein